MLSNVFVLFSVKPRIDRTNLKPIIVRAGKPIKYDVDVRGEPPPEITWYHAKELVKHGGNISIENVDYNTKLSITDSVRKNTGVWKIRAVNASGEDEAEVEVTVLCKFPLEKYTVIIIERMKFNIPMLEVLMHKLVLKC